MIGLQPQGRAAMGTIPLRPELVELTGDYRYALLLQQLCFDTSRSPDGWVRKTSAELAAPFGSVSTRTIERWIDHMETEKWIEVRRELTTAGRVNHYRPKRDDCPVIDAAIERSHGPSSFVDAGERKPDDKMSKAKRQIVEPDDNLSSPANDKLSPAPIRELESSPLPCAREDVEWLSAEFDRRGVQIPVGANPIELIVHDIKAALPEGEDFQAWATSRLASYGARSGKRQRWPSWLVEDATKRRGVAGELGKMAAKAQSGRSTRMTLNSHEGDDTIPFGFDEDSDD